jgi:hypothetical protein
MSHHDENFAGSRLVRLALAVAMGLTAVLTGAPSVPAATVAGPATGAGRGELSAALARVVLSPGRASARVGASVTYAAEGYNRAGHDLGDVTATARFTISPDGSCAGDRCAAAKAGQHTVTGTVRLRNRVIRGTAVLLVRDSKPAAAQPASPGDASQRPSPGSAGHGSGQGATPGDGNGPRRGGTSGRSSGRQAGLIAGAHLVLTPRRAFIPSGGHLTYAAEAVDAAGNPLGDVTDRTSFAVSFTAAERNVPIRPEGSCTGPVCTATKLGRHTVTGTADLGGRTLTGTAALQVVPRHRRGVGPPNRPPPQLASLELLPQSSAILSGDRQHYKAAGYDKAHHFLGFLTEFTTFTISPDGSCAGNACTATVGLEPVMHTVTGTIVLKNRTVIGTASLLVLPKIKLRIHPKFKVITFPGSVSYRVDGVFDSGQQADLTDFATFRISPPGFCAANICSGPVGRYKVTAIVHLGDHTLTATAILVVVSRVHLVLIPHRATVFVGTRVPYRAELFDSSGRFVADVTEGTSFTISPGPPGFCPHHHHICFATRAGRYKITGKAIAGGRALFGFATLIVLNGPSGIVKLRLLPKKKTVRTGEHVRYRAEGLDARGSVTSLTREAAFTILPDPPGSCPGHHHICFATRPGGYQVKATVTINGETLRATARLRVIGGRPPPPGHLRLVLSPKRAVIGSGGSVTYSAEVQNASGNVLADLTAGSTFTITRGDSCSGSTCTATRLGVHAVTARGFFRGHRLTGSAKLLVVGGTVIDVGLAPASAVIKSGDSRTYTVTGTEANGNGTVPLTGFASLRIRPDGSCTGAKCTATKTGPHTVIATVNLGTGLLRRKAKLLVVTDNIIDVTLQPPSAKIGPAGKQPYITTGTEANGHGTVPLTGYTRFAISPDGSCTRATCTASKVGRHVVTATVTLAASRITRTATLLVAAAGHCTPTSRDVVGKLQVSPRRGPPGTRLHVTARLSRDFAHCALTVRLGGSHFGGVVVQPDGSVSLQGHVSDDAKSGITRIQLTTASGQILGTATFDVTSLGFLPRLWHRTPLWLRVALAVLLLLALLLAIVTGDRPRRHRRWVSRHVHAEGRAAPEDVTVGREADATPGFSVRVLPHAGTGTTEIRKEGD